MILNYIFSIDTDTMEFTIRDAEAPKNAVSVKLPVSEEPKLVLSDNKFTLNDEAIRLLRVSVGDKIAIVFDSIGRPMIGSADSLHIDGGNKLTKSKSVSFRGKMNGQLAKFGNEFIIKEDGEGIGVLTSNGEPIEVVEEVVPDEEPPEKTDNSIATDLFDLVGSDDDFTMSSFDFSFK